MSNYIDLNRRFVERKKYDHDELITSEVTGKRLEWPKVLAARVAVIVAPANFGKTTEMQQRAKQMRDNSDAAVFIALRGMADRGSFEKALDTDELAAYQTWKAAPSTLTLFVDSLDEAAAGLRDGIEYLVGDIARELAWPNERVRWVISTRPAVLTSEVLEKLTKILMTPILAPSVVTSASPSAMRSDHTDAVASRSSTSSESEPLRLFSMMPLDSKQAEAYLTARYLGIAAGELLSVARERGLSGFTTSPGGLDILACIQLLDAPPESLTEVFTRAVDAVQVLRGADPRLEGVGTPDPTKLVLAVQKLASASQVCQLVNIEMPESMLSIPEKALSARRIATPMLTERALDQLLNSQLFIDVGFHQVKLYPDELAPFLAAQRLTELVQSPDHAHTLVKHFSWSAESGEQGVYRQFLPLMGWLATLNPHFREEILRLEPQALAFFGDLRNPAVPPEACKEALRESIRRLVKQGDRLGRGMFNLTSENFWQAGPDKLIPLIKQLFDQYGNHHWARDTLIDIVTACRSDALRSRVLKAHGNRYERLLEHTTDVRYMLELGVDEDLAGLAAAVKASKAASESLVATLVSRLGWLHFTPSELARLIDKQFSCGSGGFHIGYAIESGDLLESATDEQLYELCRGLVVRVARLGDRRGRLVQDRGRVDDRYVEAAAEAVAALVKRSTVRKHLRLARLCLVLQRVLLNVGTADVSELRQAIQGNAPVRQALLEMAVSRAGQNENKLWSAVFGYEAACVYTAEDIQALNAPLLNKVHAEVESTRAARPASPPAHKAHRSREDRLKVVGAEAKRQLRAMLPSLRDGTATNGLAWAASWLAQNSPSSRYGEVDFETFEREAGQEIAHAVRDGFGQAWRKRPPQFKEDEPRSTYHITVAGLQGLHLELGDGEQLPALSDDEIRRALRYGVFEINGYPKWFWKLVEAHEAVAADEFIKMVGEASNGAVSREHAEELLARVGEAPIVVRHALAPLAWAFLRDSTSPREYLVDRLLHAVMAAPDAVAQVEFEQIALAKMKGAFKSPLQSSPDEALTAQRHESVIWAANWLTRYPASFRKFVTNWGPKDPAGVQAFIFQLAVHLGQDREGELVQLARTSDDGVATLEMLYLWTAWAVRPEEDIKRPNGQAYSPDARDHAEQLRNSLIPAIASARSQAAYEVLARLRQAETGLQEMYLRRVQFEMREAQFGRPPLHQTKYEQFEQDFCGDVTNATSFAMAVHSDLLEVKYDIERGEHSLRRFFSEVAFKDANKKGQVTDKAGLALEADFQRLLASELNHHTEGRYSVTVESHTAEAKRRDVLCSRNDWRASIELKMSMRWTLEQYVEALEKQLVGQYMRHRKASVGFFVVVLQEKGRQWKNPATGKMVGFDELLSILRERVQTLEVKDRSRYLRVIGIDATSPEDFRKKRKALSGKPARKNPMR
jgi:hypothetical protein